MHSRRIIISLFLIVGITLSLLGSVTASTPSLGYDPDRAKLLSYLLKDNLPRDHYSHKSVNNDLSEAAFELFIKSLDSQKRFLLKPDIAVLNPYRLRIDNEIKSGSIRLPLVASEIIRDRHEVAEALVTELLARDFNFNRREFYETDPDKIDFAATEAELKERWRMHLKYQVLNRYLELEEEERANRDNQEVKVKQRTAAERQIEAREKTLKSYKSLFSRLRKIDSQDYFNNYLNAITRSFDPHTVYLPPKDKEDFDINMRGSLEGIGATLREEDGYIKVIRVIPGSAAARQGQLEAEDEILAVAQGADEPVDIVDMRLRDAVSLIRGKKGTEVRLTVRKPDARIISIPIVRDVVQIEETFVKGTTFKSGKQNFGYIKIPSFYRDFAGSRHGKGRNATDDVRSELLRMQQEGIDGLIIDLRNDGGGALQDAVKIAGFFIKEGPVVQVRDNSGFSRTHEDDSGETLYDGPLAIMVNQFSASSSEILAAVLQDYGRAVIIGGAKTHGKGTVQAIVDLDRRLPFRNMAHLKPLGALKVTIQKFYRVSGESTQYRGIVPDIILPDRLGHLKSGEQYIDHSLPWDTVAPVAFDKWAKQPLPIPLLQTESQKRIAANEEFQKIVADAARARERSENTRHSLFIKDVRKLREEIRRLSEEGEEAGLDGEPAHSKKGTDPEAWRKDAAEDPYILETMQILHDLRNQTSGLARNGR